MKYVVKAAWDDSKWTVEELTAPNSRVVGRLPEGEDPEWLQLENIDDGSGNMIPTLTVDEVKKTQVLQVRIDAELQASQEAEAKRLERQAKKDKIKALKENKINNLDEIKAALLDIKEMLLEMDGPDGQ